LTISDVVRHLAGEQVTASAQAVVQASGGYASDLLSDVIANAREGDVWITMQRHINVVAVARLKGLACVVLVNGRRPEADTLARAEAEEVPIVVTQMPAFQAAGVLFSQGLQGKRD
jgi:hypothetical protein